MMFQLSRLPATTEVHDLFPNDYAITITGKTQSVLRSTALHIHTPSRQSYPTATSHSHVQ